MDRLVPRDWTFESVHFMAAAATVDLFAQTLLPRLQDRTVKQLHVFHLDDTAEQLEKTAELIDSLARRIEQAIGQISGAERQLEPGQAA